MTTHSRSSKGLALLLLRLSKAVFLVVAFLAAFRLLAGQDLPYTSPSTGVDGAFTVPIPIEGRGHHAAAFDMGRGRLIVFSGSHFVNDISTLVPPNWSSSGPAEEETSPSGRYGHGMVYDAARDEVVLFGGYDPNVGDVADTWVWNGSQWRDPTPTLTASPSARSKHSMAYDSEREEVVLFGGSAGTADTWIWDGERWMEKTPATSPTWGWAAGSMAYDADRGETVLFSPDESGETWVWNGETWTQRFPPVSPSARSDHAIAYDNARGEVVLFGGLVGGQGIGSSETWIWDGESWSLRATRFGPGNSYFHTMTYDPLRSKCVVVIGYGPGNDSETWLWDGENWALESSPRYVVDMAEKPDGIWNYTSIHVPEWATIFFLPNASNTPVQWMATENVRIDGIINLTGQDQFTQPDNLRAKDEALGGPGGYRGGLGGTRFSVSGSYSGMPGSGPGGGAPGSAQDPEGKDGAYEGTYGNALLQPLIGGSGGGGGASTSEIDGASGGGGGGAILIASSRDITVNGQILADGAYPGNNGEARGGYGSGGAIRLVADRLFLRGTLSATAWPSNFGRIRLEAYFHSPTAYGRPWVSIGQPTETPLSLKGTSLRIASVAGVGVVEPPAGSTESPDIVFKESGPITITVAAQNVPNGTPISLRITSSSGSVIHLPGAGQSAVRMQNNTATFTANVPAGVGRIQASAAIVVAP